jgi:hypothetical protein
MITGAHFLFYSPDAGADRAFIRDVLGFRFVELDDGWLMFALPPAELAVHPSESTPAVPHAGGPLLGAVLYLMCDDLEAFVQGLASKGIACAPRTKAAWGVSTSFTLPSGGRIGVYQPTHQTAI